MPSLPWYLPPRTSISWKHRFQFASSQLHTPSSYPGLLLFGACHQTRILSKKHLDFILPHFTTKILRSSLYYCSSIYTITRTNSAEHFIISTCAAVTVLHLIQWLVELHFNILLKVMFRYFYIHSDAFPFRTAVLHNSSSI